MTARAPPPYRFVRAGRSWTAVLAVLGVWLACLIAWLVLDAAGWIVGVVLLFTLPALADLWRGTDAGLEIDAGHLRWWSGSREVRLALSEIDHVRLVTRLDLSVRMAAVLTGGKKIRAPIEATPPARELDPALRAHGLRTERHHFTAL
jgi:hypothetical protein